MEKKRRKKEMNIFYFNFHMHPMCVVGDVIMSNSLTLHKYVNVCFMEKERERKN